LGTARHGFGTEWLACSASHWGIRENSLDRQGCQKGRNEEPDHCEVLMYLAIQKEDLLERNPWFLGESRV
jgi:hypothetical protein